ncbi:MAG TPA: hypothetical protein VMZ52_12605 [Bryobacteraceae bacterium]|nr:hypothetical protein [Bryobacteraceae bacterium]
MKLLFSLAILVAAAAPAADKPILWKDWGPVESLDLAGGPGGSSNAPKPPFTFKKEDSGGTAPKVAVTDARGTDWAIKFGPEVKPETFATRLVWAAGYMAEPTYYVREGTIRGVGKLGRAAEFIDAAGAFHDGRFQIRDKKQYVFHDTRWSFDEKSVKGTKELNGLKILIVLLSNWDVKPINTAIIETGGQAYYAISDWGATMGKSGEIGGHSKWECAPFAAQTDHLIEGVADGYVSFNYTGKSADQVANNIRVEDVQWFMRRMGKLSDAQIRAALEASGATPEEIACFTASLRKRLDMLAAIANVKGGSAPSRESSPAKRSARPL